MRGSFMAVLGSLAALAIAIGFGAMVHWWMLGGRFRAANEVLWQAHRGWKVSIVLVCFLAACIFLFMSISPEPASWWDGVSVWPTEVIRLFALTLALTFSFHVLRTFAAMLGTVAGNLVLTLGARGGVYIGGGIVPRLGERFAQLPFRERFEAKGRFRDYLAAVPCWVITAESPALMGAARALDVA